MINKEHNYTCNDLSIKSSDRLVAIAMALSD